MNKKTNKTTVLSKSGKYYVLGVSIILVIAFAHFGLQMFFIQNENSKLVETAGETAPPIEKTIESQPETVAPVFELKEVEKFSETKVENVETRKIRAESKPEIVKPKIRQLTEIVPVRASVKKKVARETKVERLRRVERILTGV